MAPDFSVAWQCLSKRAIGFLLRIKLHADKELLCNVKSNLKTLRPVGTRTHEGELHPVRRSGSNATHGFGNTYFLHNDTYADEDEYYVHWLKRKSPIFRPELVKIAENCDHMCN
jgi:hypothetical protein